MKRMRLSGAAFKKRRVLREIEEKRVEGAPLKYFNGTSRKRPPDEQSVSGSAGAGECSQSVKYSNSDSTTPEINCDEKFPVDRVKEHGASLAENVEFSLSTEEDHAHPEGDGEDHIYHEGMRSIRNPTISTLRAGEPYHSEVRSLSSVCQAETLLRQRDSRQFEGESCDFADSAERPIGDRESPQPEEGIASSEERGERPPRSESSHCTPNCGAQSQHSERHLVQEYES